MGAKVQLTVFGGLRVLSDGDEVALGSSRASTVLSLLITARGATVASHELVDLLWPEEPPATALNQVHRLIGQIRRVVGASVVRGAGTGYRLDTMHLACDLFDFDTATARARSLSAAASSNASPLLESVDAFVAALEIARQPAFAGLGAALDHPAFASVGREHIAVVGEALECALRAGVPERVMRLAEPVLARVRFDESLHARMIRALGHGGRVADALKLYADVRRRLREELGVDPGMELRAAHQEILQLGGTAATKGLAPPPNRSVRPVPAQLPAPLPGLTERREVHRLLLEIAAAGDANTVVMTAIGGMGGIGKTTLAVHWAHQIASRFPDGQIYVNLRGFDAGGRVMEPLDALSSMLNALGAPRGEEDDGLETRAARFRSLVSGRRLLLLLDNARDADQVRPLLPGDPGCLVIVTSRNRMTGLVVHEGAVPVALDRMDREQSLQLLVSRLGSQVIVADPVAAQRIVQACAGLPLALSMVAARIATEPRLTLQDVAAELTQSTDLSPWSVGRDSDDLATVFRWSYESLDAESSRLFRLLAIHPGPELSVRSIASIAGIDLNSTRAVLDDLRAANLVDEISHDRYTIHDLLRVFVAQLMEGDLERLPAERRLVDHAVRSTRQAWLPFGRAPVGQLDAPDSAVTPETFADKAAALAWYEKEHPVLTAALHLACARGWHRAAANLAIDWRPMDQALRGRAETMPHALAALAAAQRSKDPVLEAELTRDVGMRAARMGDVEGGDAQLARAFELYGASGDPVGQANTLRNRAAIAAEQGNHGAAAELAAAAVDIAEAAGAYDVVLLAILGDFSGRATRVRDWAAALAQLRRARGLAEMHHLPSYLPMIDANLTEVLFELGQHAEAVTTGLRALETLEDDFAYEAATARFVASAAMALGDVPTSQLASDRFRDVERRVGDETLNELLWGFAAEFAAAVTLVEAQLPQRGQLLTPTPTPTSTP